MKNIKFDACKSISNILNKIEEYKVNKTQFSRELGMDRETLLNITLEKIKNPGIYTLAHIADYLEISIDELVGRRTPAQKNTNRSTFLSQNLQFEPTTYAEISKLITDYIEKNKITASFDQILNALDSIYDYSIKQNTKKPDTKFAYWILDKLFS